MLEIQLRFKISKYSYAELLRPVLNSVIGALEYRIKGKTEFDENQINYFCNKVNRNCLIRGFDFGYDYVFKRERYKGLRLQGNVVLDIGANIGDSSIYFFCNGAETVYCLEPSPFLFRILRANIIYNNLQNHVIPMNIGIDKKKTMLLSNSPFSNDIVNRGTPLLEERANGAKTAVKFIDLDTIVNELPLENAVLKMSCEGCEYESILESKSDTLRTFTEIFLEFFDGKYKLLGKKLIDSGFEIKYKNVNYDLKKDRILGFIIARRK